MPTGATGALLATVATGGAVSFECLVADAFEPNNTAATAREIENPHGNVVLPATLAPLGDEDWFRYSLGSMGMIKITGATMDVYHSASGAPVATGVTCSETGRFVRVHGPVAKYTLTIMSEKHPGC
jgi:hypothetical protein